MRETDLSRQLVKAIRETLQNSVVFKHTDLMTAGIPDISVTWLRVTSWLEVKVLRRGKLVGRGVQDETCRRLERVGLCYYVVYSEAETLIALPRHVVDGRIDGFLKTFGGIDHAGVATFLALEHHKLGRSGGTLAEAAGSSEAAR